MAITTTVAWADLRDAQQSELDDLREAYDDLETTAQDEYGEDALSRPVPNDLDDIDDEETRALAAIQQQAALYEQSRETVEKRLNLLEVLEGELGDDPWEIKMLSGQEVMNVEAELRADRKTESWDRQMFALVRNYRTVDAAVVDGPEDIPREDGTLNVSENVPNALVNSLYEQVERFNSAGETGFRSEGFGSPPTVGGPSGSSATPASSNTPSKPSAPDDESVPERGSDS